ncbi:MAG: hypothetical protein U9Q92_01000 [archaeon]|nr:hypothetical protein [archaeon]
MDGVKNAGIVLFSLGIGVILLYVFYLFIADFIGDDMPLVIKAGLLAMFAGLVIVMVQLVFERISDSKKEKKSLKEGGGV